MTSIDTLQRCATFSSSGEMVSAAATNSYVDVVFSATDANDAVSTLTWESVAMKPSSSSSSSTASCALFDFVAYTVVGGSLFLFGVIGNSLSFVVLQRQRGDGAASSATTLLLRALAVADTLVLIAAMPLYAVTPISAFIDSIGTDSNTGNEASSTKSSAFIDLFRSYYNLYPSIMPYLWPLYLIPYTATVWLTVLVSADRYAAVCRPFRSAASKLQSGSRSCRQVAFVALLSVVYNIPRFFEYKRGGAGGSSSEFRGNDGEFSSEFRGNDSGTDFFNGSLNGTKSSLAVEPSLEFSDFGKNNVYRILYTNILYFIVLHGGPIVLLAFLNVRLIVALKVQDRKRMLMNAGRSNAFSSAAAAVSLTNGTSATGQHHSHHHNHSQQQQQHQQDLTLTLVVVVFVFITCQTPTFIDHVLWTVFSKEQTKCGHWHYYYTAVGDVLAILNSSVNFIVYVVASPKFRRGLAALLFRRRLCCSRTSEEAADGCGSSRKSALVERDQCQRRTASSSGGSHGCCHRKFNASTTYGTGVTDGLRLDETASFLKNQTTDAEPVGIQNIDSGLVIEPIDTSLKHVDAEESV